MKKKNNLFELIQSLTPAEKRHFIGSLPPEKNSRNYLRLFVAIGKLKEYDEAIIKKKFKEERFINQLHVLKSYLHESILKSLRNYHSSSSIAIRLKNLLKNIEIYFDKELFDQCALEIQKAERIACKYEDDLATIEILNWKRKLAQYQAPGTLKISDIIAEQTLALSRLTHQNALWQSIASGIPKEISAQEMESTLSSKVLTHHIRYRTSIHYGRTDEAKRSLIELLNVLEKYPHRTQEEPTLYLSTINNLVSFLVFTKEYKEALEYISKAKAFYTQTRGIRKRKNDFRLILRTYNIELEIYRDTESMGPAVTLVNEIRTFLSEHQDNIPSSYLISLWFQFAYIFFLKRDFREALHWINEILNSPFDDDRVDLQLQTHLLNLMVHLELRNFFVMRYFVSSTTRFFKRNKALRSYHKVMLAFFTKISGAPESEHGLLFEKLSGQLFTDKELIPLSDLDYINWKRWLETKK